MKPVLLFVLGFLLIADACYSQKSKLKKNPPGTVQVNDTLFVDITEMPNVGWREYLHYLIGVKKDTLAYEQAFPDTTIWTVDNTGRGEYYFRHPSFNDSPVVGISYDQVIAFCKWRTFVVNLALYVKENNISDWRLHLTDSFPIRLYYRLPTTTEWETIAAGKYLIDKFPYGYPDIYVKQKRGQKIAFNCRYISESNPDNPVMSFYTVSVNSFFKNSSGTYNMIGNVAEMVAEEGTAKGGSFFNLLEDCKITQNQQFQKPERWLGFRCVAVKLK